MGIRHLAVVGEGEDADEGQGQGKGPDMFITILSELYHNPNTYITILINISQP